MCSHLFTPFQTEKQPCLAPPQQLCPSQFSCKPSKTNGMRPSLETFVCVCLNSSKDNLLTRSAQRLNWHVPRYVYINVSDTDPSPTLACLNASVSNAFSEFCIPGMFRCVLMFLTFLCRFSLVSTTVHVCAYTRPIHMVTTVGIIGHSLGLVYAT